VPIWSPVYGPARFYALSYYQQVFPGDKVSQEVLVLSFLLRIKYGVNSGGDLFVIPAKAGIQDNNCLNINFFVIPAKAGIQITLA
jgi:hypothetical protein